MKAARKLVVFTDRFPLLGPIIWILCAQYFAAQIIAAAAWVPAYSWSANLISDLGNTACGPYSGRFVCSPLAGLMNISFMILGVTMAAGALLIYQEFQESRASLVGFGLMMLAGIGTIFVGAFPENTISFMHGLGAFLALVVGNISLVVLALALGRVRRSFRVYTFASGVITLVAFGLFYSGTNLGLGQGGMERLVSYPQTLWLTLFGLYMTVTHIRAARRRV